MELSCLANAVRRPRHTVWDSTGDHKKQCHHRRYSSILEL